ncbi:MAG: BBP7 family outer membrane beta-barrel protein, partial [Planctomycetaceae bacterium]|nr:BBP7 family outer membrane beta-barrel protein [Planctomycetaceae bacterium]
DPLGRVAYPGNGLVNQTNTIKSNQFGAVSGLGTRAEIGNNRGHHGWSIGGDRVKGNNNIEKINASMVIRDLHNVEAYAFVADDFRLDSAYNPNAEHKFDRDIPGGNLIVNGSGPRALWGWFMREYVDPLRWERVAVYVEPRFDNNGNVTVPGYWTYEWEEIPSETYWIGELAPLPINFENTTVTTKVEHWVIDAVYTYRLHPTRFGHFDMFGGIRYMEVDDSLIFLGEGSPWKGVERVDDPNSNELTGSAFGVGSVLGDSRWDFKADNHIIAPQIGGRWTRTNNRWTLSAEGRFIAGFNQQNLRSKGSVGTYYNDFNQDIFTSGAASTFLNYMEGEVYPWTPIGLVNSGRSFNHSKTHHAFSPGVEVKVNANWQLTNAVGINFGVTGMWVDEIARGSKINDYTIFNSGQLFGLKNSGFSDSALMYGINFGVTVNRY